MDPAELQPFFGRGTRAPRERGVLCAITSGMARVHYRTALGTQEGDLLAEARQQLGAVGPVPGSMRPWLPDIGAGFHYLHAA
jgi:hypothetical protein